MGALCYFMEEFSCLPSTSYESCTSDLQTLHQLRKRTLSPCAVKNIKFTKAVYGKDKKLVTTNYDPRPVKYQGTSKAEITTLVTIV